MTSVRSLPSQAGHSWARMDEPELELSGQVAWRCERCGHEDCLSLDGTHPDPGATLDRWAALGTGLTCDDLMVQEVLGS